MKPKFAFIHSLRISCVLTIAIDVSNIYISVSCRRGPRNRTSPTFPCSKDSVITSRTRMANRGPGSILPSNPQKPHQRQVTSFSHLLLTAEYSHSSPSLNIPRHMATTKTGHEDPRQDVVAELQNELPPRDRGRAAWTTLTAISAIAMATWGTGRCS